MKAWAESLGGITYPLLSDFWPHGETAKKYGVLRLEGYAVEPTSKLEEEKLPQGGVVVYCTSWCPDCRKARKWLAEHRVDYVEVDVAANPKAAAQVRQWANGNLVTPTFDINDTIVVDWDEEKVASLLQE